MWDKRTSWHVADLDISTKLGGSPFSQDPKCHQRHGRVHLVAALQWNSIDNKATDTARFLAADAVERVGNGHPGTAMSLAPAAYLLVRKFMRRDRPTATGLAATVSCCPTGPARSRNKSSSTWAGTASSSTT